VLLASCGGDDEASLSDRCENVPPGLVAAIEAGLTLTGGSGTLTNGKAVKSNDFKRVYFTPASASSSSLAPAAPMAASTSASGRMTRRGGLPPTVLVQCKWQRRRIEQTVVKAPRRDANGSASSSVSASPLISMSQLYCLRTAF
jgi:hypothetical protein